MHIVIGDAAAPRSPVHRPKVDARRPFGDARVAEGDANIVDAKKCIATSGCITESDARTLISAPRIA
jgi:hypothetical protein